MHTVIRKGISVTAEVSTVCCYGSFMLHKCAPTSFFPGVEVQCSEKTQKTQLPHLCRPQLACEMLTLMTEQLEKD